MAKKLYKKAFNNSSKGKATFWQSIFYLSILIKVFKWLFAKAQPKVSQQIDLEPGEYKITVQDPNRSEKK